jgi:glutaryl-CoA dehydrogenase
MSAASDLWPGDFYYLRETLPAEDQALLADLRAFLEAEVAPVITDYWTRAEFPHHLIPGLARLGIIGTSYQRHGFRGRSALLDGFISLELARVDPSIATFFGVHSGLAAGSIYLCGSEEQKARWLPAMACLEKIGSFGLTEPEVGSGAAGGLTTTCRREGDGWLLNGAKRWIGNASFADLNVIWARDVADNQVKGFVVEKGTPGFSAEVMKGKIALRVVQNAMITLSDCRVPAENKLANANRFADTAKVLKMTRGFVAWQATGCALGAFEHALAYAKRRHQFGRPIGGFQLVQDQLVRMLAGITTSMTLCHRLAQLQDEDRVSEEQASLAKA